MPSKVKRRPPADTPKLEVAVVGSGISPEDLNIRQLAELLIATSAALDAIATERGIPPVHPCLKTIRRGSAVAVLWSEEPVWPNVMREFYDTVATRGAQASERVLSALRRLYGSVKIGAVSVGAADLHGAKPLTRIVMAAPLETEVLKSTYGTAFYGRIVGVNHYSDRVAVKIEHVDGGREEFDADPSMAEAAARLFNRSVRADVEMAWDGQRRYATSIRGLKAWSESDFLDALVDARRELRARGVKFDFDAAMKEIDG